MSDSILIKNEYEDILDMIEKEITTMGIEEASSKKNTVLENAINYYKNPDLMMNLTDYQKNFYKKYIEILSQRDKKQLNEDSIYNNQRQLGFCNIIILLLFILILSLSFVFTI